MFFIEYLMLYMLYIYIYYIYMYVYIYIYIYTCIFKFKSTKVQNVYRLNKNHIYENIAIIRYVKQLLQVEFPKDIKKHLKLNKIKTTYNLASVMSLKKTNT